MGSAIRDRFRRRRYTILAAAVLVLAIVGVAVAIEYLRVDASVNVSTTGPLQLFSQPGCTGQLVTSYNFGNLIPGAKAASPIWYLKNTGGSQIIGYNWTSNLLSVSGGKITDSWLPSPQSIDANQCLAIYRYQIHVADDAPVQQYSWSISLTT